MCLSYCGSTGSDSYAIRHASGRCFAPLGGLSADNTRLVLTPDCKAEAAQFRFSFDGTLLHVLSGKCLHLHGDPAAPAEGVRLVLGTKCSDLARMARWRFAWTAAGCLQHTVSGKSVQPVAGGASAIAGTELGVFGGSCTAAIKLQRIAGGRPVSPLWNWL